jgi:hypothetical protein
MRLLGAVTLDHPEAAAWARRPITHLRQAV